MLDNIFSPDHLLNCGIIMLLVYVGNTLLGITDQDFGYLANVVNRYKLNQMEPDILLMLSSP